MRKHRARKEIMSSLQTDGVAFHNRWWHRTSKKPYVKHAYKLHSGRHEKATQPCKLYNLGTLNRTRSRESRGTILTTDNLQ